MAPFWPNDIGGENMAFPGPGKRPAGDGKSANKLAGDLPNGSVGDGPIK